MKTAVEIAKLRLARGDILVVRYRDILSGEVWMRIRNTVKPLLPSGVEMMIIDQHCEISVLTRAEIEARIA